MKPPSLILALVPALLAGCQPSSGPPGGAPASRVEGEKIVLPEGSPHWASLTLEPVEPVKPCPLTLNGRLIWDDNVTVRVFSAFAGRVRQILVEPGQTVAQNDPLAMIASPDYGQAQADARKAASDFILAQRTLNRVLELFEHGAAPQKDVQSAEADFARAELEKLRTAERLKLYGGNTNTIDQVYELKSPLGGVVVEKNINPGQEVRPDQMLANAPQLFAPLFVVSDPSHLWIQVDANEQDLPKFKPGQRLVIRSRAFPDQEFNGRVDVIADSLDPVTKIIKVRGSVDNRSRLLKAEMYVTVELTGDAAAGMDVPSKAVFSKGVKNYVFLEESRGEFSRKEIKAGPAHDGRTLILDGLQLGQRVVTEGCLLLEQLRQSTAGS